ncbi:uroporphyrinogen-III synthase [Puia sp. P3]|uniref:uroporphyrinogen-III synthase n=1 Tax=Puia sp. P3 TaxID=3423952 RepID=UPI003D673801
MSDPDIRVLSTRPLSAALIENARSKGIAIDVIPFIVTTTVADEQLLRPLKERPLTAVFTSANAVGAVGEGGDWKVYCLSGATRRAVEESLGSAVIAGTADSASQLAELIAEKEVYFFAGTSEEKSCRLPCAGRAPM